MCSCSWSRRESPHRQQVVAGGSPGFRPDEPGPRCWRTRTQSTPSTRQGSTILPTAIAQLRLSTSDSCSAIAISMPVQRAVATGAQRGILRLPHVIMRHVQVRSQLLPLLRTPLLGELLGWIYLHPDQAWSVTELADRFGTSQSTVSREADRLVEGRLVTETRRGRLRLLRANVDGPLARPLTELLALTYGPPAVLSEVLARIAGIDEVYLYGSWAARFCGEPGPP